MELNGLLLLLNEVKEDLGFSEVNPCLRLWGGWRKRWPARTARHGRRDYLRIRRNVHQRMLLFLGLGDLRCASQSSS